MPVYRAGVTKSSRIRTLLKVFERWGKLNKTQATQHVAADLGCKPEDITRSLYRDLEELVTSGDLQVTYFARDGKPIEEFDPEIHKNATAEWALKTGANGILGEGALRSAGGAFFATDRVRRGFSFESGESDLEDPGTRKFFFRLHRGSFTLSLALDAAPCAILLSRMRELSEAQKCFELAVEKYGKRTAALFLPFPGLSGFTPGTRLGHFVVQVQDAKTATLVDLNSKNGTYVFPLGVKSSLDWISRERILEKSTVSAALNPLEEFRKKGTKLAFSQETPLKLPSLVIASHEFGITIL